MPEMMTQGSVKPGPNLNSLLLLVAVLVLLASTAYIIYLGCEAFGAETFFRAIYSPQPLPEITASDLASRLIGLQGG